MVSFTKKSSGLKRVGVEIEFAGLSVQEAADAIASARGVGGKVVLKNSYVAVIEGGALDGAHVELDSRFANPAPEGERDFLDEMLDAFDMREKAADAASLVAPVELSTPPIPEKKLHIVDAAIKALRDAGATGTTDSPFAAYGLHLNCELDPPDPDRAVRIAAAYAFAEEWVRWRVDPDLSRRATPFVDPYPPVLAYGLSQRLRRDKLNYESFLELYALWCPTRNHGLDMWPLLGWLDEKAASRASMSKIKRPRPAFHYRLPDSDLADPDWGPAADLAIWRKIERIGDDPDLLETARKTWALRQLFQIGPTEYRRRFEDIEK